MKKAAVISAAITLICAGINFLAASVSGILPLGLTWYRGGYAVSAGFGIRLTAFYPQTDITAPPVVEFDLLSLCGYFVPVFFVVGFALLVLYTIKKQGENAK